MKRYELACLCLLASAFVLAGLLISQMQNHAVLPAAQAEMVITRGNLTIMTAQTRPNEEAIFVMENHSASLLVYRIDIARKRIDLVRASNLNQWLRAAQGGASSGSSRTPR